MALLSWLRGRSGLSGSIRGRTEVLDPVTEVQASSIKATPVTSCSAPALRLPVGAASPRQAAGRRGCGAAGLRAARGPGFDGGRRSSESWMFQRAGARCGRRVQVWARRLSPTSVRRGGSGLPRPAASGRIVSGGSWERQDRFGLPLAAWRPETPKVGAGGGHSCAPELALGANKEI